MIPSDSVSGASSSNPIERYIATATDKNADKKVRIAAGQALKKVLEIIKVDSQIFKHDVYQKAKHELNQAIQESNAENHPSAMPSDIEDSAILDYLQHLQDKTNRISSKYLESPATDSEKLDAASKTIQHSFRKNRAKLRLRAKEKTYKNDPNYTQVLHKIDQGVDAGLKELLASLTEDQFLFAFRYLLRKRDAEGRIVIDEKVKLVFEKHLITTFKLSTTTAEVDILNTFTSKGIATLVEYYKIICPNLDHLKIQTLFGSPDEWASIREGQGEKFFLLDEGAFNADDVATLYITHVQGLYVNYDNKTAYYFDSLGADESSINKIKQKLGADFVIVAGTTKIQHDHINCMIFALVCMTNISKSGGFSDRLQAMASSPSAKKILQSTLIPESIMMAQSISLLKKYDQWFSFIKNFNPEDSLENLTAAFHASFIQPVEEESNTFEKKMNSIFKNIKVKKKELLDLNEEQDLDKIHEHITSKREELLVLNQQLAAVKKMLPNLIQKRECILNELTSFTEIWLKILHQDRVLLAKASDPLKKLKHDHGAIRLRQESGKEENFLPEQIRLGTLHYMATKRSFPFKV